MKRTMKTILSWLLLPSLLLGMILFPAAADGYVNLYDPDQADIGWVTGDGTPTVIDPYRTSAPIAVAKGDVITFGPAFSTQGWHIVLMSNASTYIGAGTISTGVEKVEDLESGYSIMKYTVPENTAFLRIVLETNKQDKFLLTKNQPFTATQYDAYWAGASVTPPPPEEEPVVPDTALKGKTALFVGDSICYGQWDNEPRQAYAGRIAKKYGMTVTNPAVGGTTFSTIREYRILSQIEQYKNNTYDYVIIQGGVNDAWGDLSTGVAIPAAVGKISASYDVKDFDTTTFAGGLEELLYYTLQYYPNAIVGFITNFSTPLGASQGLGATGDMSAYYYEALKICEKWGVQVLDMYNDPYVSNTLLRTNTYAYLRDPLHPNATGYDRMAPYIGDWMATLVSREEYQKNPYAGKKVLFAGDSIAYGFGDTVKGRAWAGRMADALGIVAENKAISGASVSTIRGSHIVEQIKLPNNYYDYVIMHGGVNDSWGNEPDWTPAPVGEITEGYARKDFDTSTFAGALEEMFYYARRYFPYARLGFILNFEIPSTVCEDVGIYQEVTLEICRKWQVDCLDMYGDNVKDTLLENNSSKYMYDAGHPNAAGYNKLTPYIIDWFKTIPYTDTAILADENVYSNIIPVNQSIEAIGEITKANYAEKLTAIEAAEARLDALVKTYGEGVLPMVGQYADLLKAREAYAAFSAPTVAYGDVNADDAVDAKDALLILQAAVDKITLTQEQITKADVNGDLTLDARDALLVLQKAVAKIDRFPVELS